MRVISAFWKYLRYRFSDSDPVPEMDTDAGEKSGKNSDPKREIRGSSGAAPIDVETPPRAASPTESTASASSESSFGFSSGSLSCFSNESSTCFSGEPSTSTAAAECTLASEEASASAQVVQRPQEERLEEHCWRKKTATQGPKEEECMRKAQLGCGYGHLVDVDQDAT